VDEGAERLFSIFVSEFDKESKNSEDVWNPSDKMSLSEL
jgi:hypothetical protein